MKKSVLKNSLAFVLALITFSFTSCSLFENADDVSFSTTLEETFSVNEDTEDVDKPYETVLVLDATTDSEINKYKSKIKGFTVNKITYKISNFNGTSTTLTNATLSFSDADATAAEVVANIPSLNLGEASDNGTVYELTVDATSIAKIQNFLKADKSIKIYLNGNLSQTPVAFDVDLTLDVKVEADVL